VTVNSWINLTALWKIVVIGLLAGAGLPALFAVGLRVLAPRAGAAGAAAGSAEAGTGTGTSTDAGPEPGLPAKLVAGLCFVAVLAAMVWGVYSIFEHR
jgi:hypothetical protein